MCVASWAEWCRKNGEFGLKKSQRSFRFGSGPLIQSSGAVVIFIHVDAQCADCLEPLILPARVDVVDLNAPLATSYESLKKIERPLYFTNACLAILPGAK